MGLLGSLSVNFIGNTGGLQTAVGAAKNILNDLSKGNWSGAASAGLLAIGATAIGVGVKSVQMASEYQKSMNMVQALTGASADQMAQYDAGLKQLAVTAGVAPNDLAQGLYYVMSAGYKGAQAMNVLQLSTEDAKIGMTDQATTANALTTILKAFNVPASDAVRVNGELLETVTLGKMTMTDYAGAIGKGASAAMQYGVSQEAMNASIATMTSNGIPSAHQAVTDFTQAVGVMYANIGAVSKSLNKQGIAFDEAKFNSLDYQDKIKMLNGALEIAAEKHLKVTGVTKQAAAAIQILSQHSQEFSSDLATLSDKQAMAQKTAQAWAITQGGFAQTMDRVKAAIDVAMISLGQKLLPILTQLASAVIPLIAGFGSWISGMGGAGSVLGGFTPILDNIKGMLGVMAANWVQFGQSIQSILGGPLKQFGTTMGQLLPGFISQFLRVFNDVQLTFQDVAGTVATVIAPALGVLGEIFKNAQGVIENVIDALEGQFLPAIHNLITAIAPVIAGILTWIQTSGVLPIIFNILSVAITFVINAVSFLINVISALITFFSQTTLGVAMFRAILIILAVVLGIIGAVILYVVIPAFIAWVAGAIAVGIANVIAFAPIVLIVLAVIAVVTIVVLVIMKWGDIAHFLQGVWAAFASWFMGALHAVGAFFVGVWNGIVVGLKAAWDFIIQVVKIGILTVLVIMFAPIIAIVALFLWLYNHNYYFKDLVDAIVNFVKAGISWLTSAWHNVITWIVSAWQFLATAATMYFMFIYLTIQSKVQQIVSWLQGIWTNVVSFLANVWAKIAGGVSAMWTAIGGFFASAWSSYVVQPLQSLWNNILSFVGGWPAQAVQWGINLIKGFINGIMSMIGSVGSAIGNVASKVAGFLGFHSPSKEGPGRELDIWGPNLVKGFAAGIQKGIPQVQAAVNMAIKPVKDGFTYPQNTRSGYANGGNGNGGGNNQPVIFTVEMDGKEIARKVAPQIVGNMRLQAGIRA